MILLPFSPPHVGVNIDTHIASMVEIGRPWFRVRSKPSVRACRKRELPPGLIRLSSTLPNVSDASTLAGHLRALLGRDKTRGRRLPIALTLPDSCARMALVEFDQLPKKTSECEALLRWRLQKEQNISMADVRMVYRIVSATRCSEQPHQNRVQPPIRVLVASIKQSIIEQYEQICEEAELIPLSVGFASLRLFDLYRTAMQSSMGDNEEFFFLSVGMSQFSFFAFRQGIPVFLRVKSWSNGRGVSAPMLSDSLAMELRATLEFYDERVCGLSSHLVRDRQARPLFIVINSDGNAVALDSDHRDGRPQPSAVSVNGTALGGSTHHMLDGTLGVECLRLGWDSILSSRIRRSSIDPNAVTASGVPAMAGVLEG